MIWGIFIFYFILTLILILLFNTTGMSIGLFLSLALWVFYGKDKVESAKLYDTTYI